MAGSIPCPKRLQHLRPFRNQRLSPQSRDNTHPSPVAPCHRLIIRGGRMGTKIEVRVVLRMATAVGTTRIAMASKAA